MSRNYEILRQEDKDEQLFATPGVPERFERKEKRHNGSIRGCEEVVKLVQRVFLSPGTAVPRVIVFSAAERGSGCSWVCARAAEVLAAQVESSVCAVDGNLRFPSLNRHLGISTNGFGGNGSSLQECVRKVRDNLSLLPANSLGMDHHGLMNSDRLQARVLELRSEFSHVLIDAPPVNLYADACVLGRMADGVVLVLEANATRREQARKAKETLEAAGVHLLGAVLNKRSFPIPGALYARL